MINKLVIPQVRRYLGWIRNVVIGFSGPALRAVNEEASKDLQDIANMTADMTADFETDSQVRLLCSYYKTDYMPITYI